MHYTPFPPAHLGLTRFSDINIKEIVPFIQWKFFFHAWRLNGNYEGIESVCECTACQTAWLQQFSNEEREKAKEALTLYRDAREILKNFLEKRTIRINAVCAFYPAYSENENIVVNTGEKALVIPTLRQQHPSNDGFCYSLADFLAPKDDYIGFFATTVLGIEELAKHFESKEDTYRAILIKTIGDRLAEATAEWLHFQIRTRYWGYQPDEKPDIASLLKNKYQGIRPAVGYPSLPDQSIIFDIEPILELNKTGISLTENGAMFPNSSVCGLYFAHPQAKYFMIGKIDEEQLNDYAQRRGKSKEEIKKWLISNL